MKYRILALLILILSLAVGLFVYSPNLLGWRSNFKLGLDLAGGAHLVYEADTTNVESGDVSGAMNALREVIERRVNLFGVAEPIVQVEKGGALAGGADRLIVELPGVTDVDEAIKQIGETPLLEFRLANSFLEAPNGGVDKSQADVLFTPTGLTGRYLDSAQVIFKPNTREPSILLKFNSVGSDLFANITKNNVGRVLAIFLDGQPISTPVIQEEIRGGSAEITGRFTLSEAKKLVRDLNYGALPVPIKLISKETIGPSLGERAVKAGIQSGFIAFVAICAFLVLWYRLPGVIASLALAIYTVLNLAVFKLIPVTLTAAGIAGFILSLGMAVDANILIFERLKEELRRGRHLADAMREGFARAWTSIRDSNLSSMITAVILYYFASTPIIKGFALVFGIGVLVSMFSAITVSRLFLYALGLKGDGSVVRFLFGSGIYKDRNPNTN
jgi:protein-export membrane protein SecD